MVRTTFTKILRRTRYKIGRKVVEQVLEDSGYAVYNNGHKLSAYKHSGENRFHIEIDIFQDNEIHKESELRIHKDIGHGLFHDVESGKDEVSLEFQTVINMLMRQLGRNRMDNNKLIRRYQDISTEQAELLKEIITRYNNKELTPEQFEEVRNTASRIGAYLIDMFAKGVKKDDIKKALNNVVDLCTDENR